MTPFGLVRRYIAHRALRSFLTGFAVFVAFLIFGVLFAFKAALDSGGSTTEATRLVTVSRINFTQNLPLAYVERVRALKGVSRVSYADWFGGFYREPRNFLVAFAVDPESYLDIYSEYLLTPEERATFLAERGSMVVGERLAAQWGWKVGDRVPVSSNIYSREDGSITWDFTIAGIIRGLKPRTDTNFLIFHHDYFNETRNIGRDSFGWMVLETTGPEVNDRVIAAVDAMFANSPNETETKTEEAFSKAFAEQLGNIGMLVVSVSGAAFFTILLIAGNTMMLAIRERTRDIAVLKTVGFAAPRLFRMVLAESLLIAGIGGLLGLLAAALLFPVVNSLLAGTFPALIMTPGVLASGLGLIILLGLVTGILPALRAMRLDIVAGLARRG